MLTMENTRELIDFEYYGKSYRMAHTASRGSAYLFFLQ